MSEFECEKNFKILSDELCRCHKTRQKLQAKLKEVKDKCPCGGVMYADTEKWDSPLCYECYIYAQKHFLKNDPAVKDMVEALETCSHVFGKKGGNVYGWIEQAITNYKKAIGAAGE